MRCVSCDQKYCYLCVACEKEKSTGHGNRVFNDERLCESHFYTKQKVADYTDLKTFLKNPTKGFEGVALWGQMCSRFIERYGAQALTASIDAIEKEKKEAQYERYNKRFVDK